MGQLCSLTDARTYVRACVFSGALFVLFIVMAVYFVIICIPVVVNLYRNDYQRILDWSCCVHDAFPFQKENMSYEV